jgi:predicted trehalose synthase
VARRVPALAEYLPAIRRVYGSISRIDTTRVQRIHGDLHLGQALRTPEDWLLIDFEGEPARPLAERRVFQPPLRDVAGLLRSLDYAAAHHPGGEAWLAAARSALSDGYAARGSDAVLLRALELSRAVYEVGYEAANRPDWLPIPLAGVAALAVTA